MNKTIIVSVLTTIATNIILNTFLFWLVLIALIVIGWWKLHKWTGEKANELWMIAEKPYQVCDSGGWTHLMVTCDVLGVPFWHTVFPSLKRFKFQNPIKFEKNLEESEK